MDDDYEQIRQLNYKAAAARALAELSDRGTAKSLIGYAAGLEFLADAIQTDKPIEHLLLTDDNDGLRKAHTLGPIRDVPTLGVWG